MNKTKRATEFNRQNYDEIKFRVPKGYKERFKNAVESNGESMNLSLNNFVCSTIGEKPKEKGGKSQEKVLLVLSPRIDENPLLTKLKQAKDNPKKLSEKELLEKWEAKKQSKD